MSVLELTLHDRDDPNGTALGTLTEDDLEAIKVRKVRRGLGSLEFVVDRRNNIEAAWVQPGNVAKLALPWISDDPLLGFLLDELNVTLLSQSDDQSGVFGGPSLLGLLRYARLPIEPSAPDQPYRGSATVENVWYWKNQPYGAIVVRMLEEGQVDTGSPLEHLTWDFTRLVDSDSASWAQVAEEYETPIGPSILSSVVDLEDAGDLFLDVSPTLNMSARQSQGVNRVSTTFAAGKVRLTAANTLGELPKRGHGFGFWDKVTVEGKDGTYITRTSPDWVAGTPARYGYVKSDRTNDPALMAKIGDYTLLHQRTGQDTIEVEVTVGDDELNGLYLPFVHYDVGDRVTVHTGSGEHDYNNKETRITGIRIELGTSKDTDDETRAKSLHVILELNGVTSDAGDFDPGSTAGTREDCTCTIALPFCRPSTASETSEELFSWDWESGDETVPAIASLGMPSGTVARSFDTHDSWYALLDNSGSNSSFPRGADNLAFPAGAEGQQIRLDWVARHGGAFTSTKRMGIEWITGDYADWTGGGGIDSFVASEELVESWPQPGGIGTETAHSVIVTVPPGGITAFRLNSNAGGTTTTYRVHSIGATIIGEEGDPFEGHPDLVGTGRRISRCDHSHHVLRDVPPTDDDDASIGYNLLTGWIQVDDLDAPTAIVGRWILVDNSDGAAVWLEEETGTPPASTAFGAELARLLAGDGFLYVVHRDNGGDYQVYGLAGYDGETFDIPIGPEPLFTPITTGGEARDGAIMRWRNRFYIAHTGGTAGSGNFRFTVYELAANLTDAPSLVASHSIAGSVPGATAVWAPKFFRDPEQSIDTRPYMLLAVADGGSVGSPSSFGPMYVQYDDDGLASISGATAITGTGFPAEAIDPWIAYIPEMGTPGMPYKLFLVDDGAAKTVGVWESASPFSGYVTLDSDLAWSATDHEAPVVIDMGDGRWRGYYNKHSGFDSLGAFYRDWTPDDGWGAEVAVVTPWLEAHGTVLRLADTFTTVEAPVVTSHDELDGLADDDHTQYLTTGRHSAIDHGDPHVHIVDEQHSGDGSSTVFTLANEAQPETAIAYVAGVRTSVTVTGSMNDQVTFAVAPASGTDNVSIDYVAVGS